ncbi:LysR family transcriptional regulator [Burkholderia sp. PU8-34]
MRYFKELANSTSLRKASERLHVAPTAISRQIELLEHHFGVQLFERGPRGIRLTAEGEFLAERVDTVLQELDLVKTLISERRNLDVGTVAVFTTEGVVSGLLAPVLAAFTRQYPRIQFDISVATARETLDALSQGHADLAIGYYLPHRDDIEKIAHVDVWHHVLVRAGHPLCSRSSVTLAELINEPLVMPNAAFGTRQALDRVARQCGITLKPTFTTGSLETQHALARQGAALLIRPSFPPRADDAGCGSPEAAQLDDSGLYAIRIADAELQQVRVELCAYRYRTQTLAAHRCAEMLKAEMARHRVQSSGQ